MSQLGNKSSFGFGQAEAGIGPDSSARMDEKVAHVLELTEYREPDGFQFRLSPSEFEYYIDRLSEIVTAEGVRYWLYAPQPFLQGISPAQAIRTGRREAVEDEIDLLNDGAFA